MKPNIEQISELLRMRGEERQGQAYWHGFVREFHLQRRAEQPGIKHLALALKHALLQLRDAKWLYGAGLAYAAATVMFFFMPRSAEYQTAPIRPVYYEVPAAPVLEQLEELRLDPAAEGTAGQQVF